MNNYLDYVLKIQSFVTLLTVAIRYNYVMTIIEFYIRSKTPRYGCRSTELRIKLVN